MERITEERDGPGVLPPPPEVVPGPGSAPRVLAGVLLVLTLFLAISGQLLLSTPRASWLAIAAFVGSFGSLLLLVRALRGRSTTRLEAWLARFVRRHPFPAAAPALVAAACAFAIAAATLSQSPDVSKRGWPAFGCWLAGVLAMAAFAAVSARRSTADARPHRISRAEIAAVAGVTLLAFLVRLVDLNDVPYPASGDEGSVGLEGVRILEGTRRDMFRVGWSAQPVLSFLGPALSLSLFGRTLTGLRLYPVLAGTLTVTAVYLVARAMFSRAVALLAALLLATMAFHIHFSRIAVNNADAALIVCVAVGLLYVLGVRKRAHAFVLAGLATGWALFSYAGARVAFVVALLYLGYLLVADAEMRRRWPRLLLLAAAVVVVTLPTAVFFLDNPAIGFGRLNEMGIVRSGWLARESEATGKPALLIFAGQLLRPLGIFVSRPAISGFYNSPKPLLDPLWSVALILGLMFTWVQLRERSSVLLNLWFWSVLVFGGILIIPPPHPQRLLIAAPAVAIFVALALWNVWSAVAKLTGRKRLAAAGAFGTAGILAIASLLFYFREYTPRYYFADAGGEVATELGWYLAREPRVRYVYFTGAPRMTYRSHPSAEFLSGGIPGADFPPETVPEVEGRRRSILFVVLPHLRSTLDALVRAYPGGRAFVVWRRPKPREPLFLGYRLD